MKGTEHDSKKALVLVIFLVNYFGGSIASCHVEIQTLYLTFNLYSEQRFSPNCSTPCFINFSIYPSHLISHSRLSTLHLTVFFSPNFYGEVIDIFLYKFKVYSMMV